MGQRGRPWAWLALMPVLLAGPWLSAASAAPPSSPGGGSAADMDALLPDPRDMARIEAAIDRGLEHLYKTQLPTGNWQVSHPGINAFALLAFLGRGHEPGRGPYKGVVDKAIGYLISIQDANGYFTGGQMYDHGLCTLALIEAYGSLPSPALRKSVQSAVDLIVRSQSPAGGWRYSPSPSDADMSATVMQVVALRAAMNAKLDVPQRTVDAALRYVRSLHHPAGGFGYQSPAQGIPTSAGGTLSMILLGAHDDPAVKKTLDHIQKSPPNHNGSYFYYTSYYAMQAFFQAGGNYWASWHPKVRDFLLEKQNEDGTWPGYGEEGFNGPAKVYSTSLALMCLEVYLHYLPAYQR